MASLIEELKRQAIAKRLQEQMQPGYSYDIDPTPQGYTEEYSRQVPEGVALPDMSMDENAKAFDMAEVLPSGENYYHQQSGKSFSPEDVEFTDNGKFRVKTWASRNAKKRKRLDEILSQYPAIKRKVPTYTDANIKKTVTRPATDINTPEGVQSLSSEVMQMGGKPGDFGLPNAAEAMKLPGELAKQKREGQGDFKTAVQVQKVFKQFNLPYDVNKSYRDNWNATVQQLDPEQRAQFINAGLEAMNPKTEQQGTALQQNAKYMSEQLGISEQEAAEKLSNLKGKTKEQTMMDAYQNSMAVRGDDKQAQEAAEAAGAMYDQYMGKKKKMSVREDINAAKGQDPAQQPKQGFTREQAIAELKRRGKI